MSHCCRFRVGSKFIIQFIVKYGSFCVSVIFPLSRAFRVEKNHRFRLYKLSRYHSPSVMDQISILIAIYIAKRKFFPAMNSRIIDAFHYNNVRVYLEQKRLLYRYKVLICFLTFTFEIYILKNLILYNLFVIFESISVNPC